ncbi:hypothetical protein [Pseudomonas sp. NPDC086278]|uniref:hypothetical protein n=1 Tax=Pseudomonas sp. NPDC086278 TaxID=3390646 RepID=UPI003D05C08B
MADSDFLSTLDDPTLFREANYIDGQWVKAGEGRTTTVTNSATGKVRGRVQSLGAKEKSIRRFVCSSRFPPRCSTTKSPTISNVP